MEEGEQAVRLRVAPRVGEEEPEVSHRRRRVVATAGGEWRGLGFPGFSRGRRRKEMGTEADGLGPPRFHCVLIGRPILLAALYLSRRF